MDLNLNYSEDENPLSLKSDFILSLCELIVGGKEGLQPVEKTVIDRCVRLVYRDYLADPKPEKMPILEDLYNELLKQDEKEAHYIATALEIYVSGSLNVFNHRTNVDNLVITVGGVADPAEVTTIGTVTTNGGRLNLRTGAGMDYEVIDQLRSGEEVTVIGTEGDWYEVIVPEKRGYVHSDYLELIEKAEQNSEIDSAMLMYLMGLMFQGFETTGDETTENGKPPFAFTPDGNLTLIDDFLQIEAPATEDSEQIEKQFITVENHVNSRGNALAFADDSSY